MLTVLSVLFPPTPGRKYSVFLPKTSVLVPPCRSLVYICVWRLCIEVFPGAPLSCTKTKKQVTSSGGIQLNAAAHTFTFWQHAPSHSFLKQWQQTSIFILMLSHSLSWHWQDSPCSGTWWISKVSCRGTEAKLQTRACEKYSFTKSPFCSTGKNNWTDAQLFARLLTNKAFQFTIKKKNPWSDSLAYATQNVRIKTSSCCHWW